MSLMFHAFATSKKRYVFDANTNSILVVTDDQYEELTNVETGKLPSDESTLLKSFQDKGYCCEANIEVIEHPCSVILDDYLKRHVSKVTLQITQKCNLRCEYCVYSGMYTHRTHTPVSMSFDVARKAIDLLLSNSSDVDMINIGFYGGEPLLEVPLMIRCIEYADMAGCGRHITYSVTTNGTLLTPEIFQLLHNKGVRITVSLDGPKAMHDRFRKHVNGKGSYDEIMSNLAEIRRLFPKEAKSLSFNSVVSPDTDDACLPEYFSMSDLSEYHEITMATVSNNYAATPFTYSDGFFSVFAQELTKLYLAMLGKISMSKVSKVVRRTVAELETKYRQLVRLPRLPRTCHPGGPCIAGATRLFVNVSGNLYPCERVSEKSEIMSIGSVDEGIDVDKAHALLNVGNLTQEQCKSCWAILHCNMCAANSDDLRSFNKGMRLSQCQRSKRSFLNDLRTICFLKEHGYKFDR